MLGLSQAGPCAPAAVHDLLHLIKATPDQSGLGESPGKLDVASHDYEPPTVEGDAVGLSQELAQAAFCMMC